MWTYWYAIPIGMALIISRPSRYCKVVIIPVSVSVSVSLWHRYRTTGSCLCGVPLVSIRVQGYHGTRVPWYGPYYHGSIPWDTYAYTCTSQSRQWCEGGSESVGVSCPAFAPSLNWLPCILPKHTWFSCVPFVRTYVRTTYVLIMLCHNFTRVRTHVYHWYSSTRVPWYVLEYDIRTYHGTVPYHGMVPVVHVYKYNIVSKTT